MDINNLLSALLDLHLWLLLSVAFGLGAAGALIHRSSQDPPDTGGAVRDALTGGVAAVAILYVSNPASGLALIGGSLVAGYAAKAVLAGLEARATAVLAVREAAERAAAARQTRADLAKLATRVTALTASPATPPDDGVIADVQQFARELQAKHAID